MSLDPTLGPAEFQQAIQSLEEAYRSGMNGFIAWLQKNWRYDTKKKRPNAEPWPGKDVERGWNTAIDSMDGALACFLDECGYG